MTIVPEFNNKIENIVTLNFKGKKFSIKKEINRFPKVRERKDLVLSLTGNSIIDISYKKGGL